MRDLLALRDAVAPLLRAVPNLDVHVGEVTNARLVPDGKAHPYAVLWVTPGNQDAQGLCGTPDLLTWRFQVTCAGGDDTRALWAVGRVRGALLGKRLDVHTGLISELEGYDPGPVRPDTSVIPARWFLPLLFTVPAT
jgi:hypothetical protein